MVTVGSQTIANGNVGLTGHNSGNNDRYSESPARTIDSHDSTTGSMDTIVDRSVAHQSEEEMMQNTIIAQSTNTTNLQQTHPNSLTHSERTVILQKANNGHTANTTSGSEDDELLLLAKEQKLQQEQQQRQESLLNGTVSSKGNSDLQSHIYSSPVYEVKLPTPAPNSNAILIKGLSLQNSTLPREDLVKPKLITHEEFKKQLEASMKTAKSTSFDTKISKKQRFPPEVIKDDGQSVSGHSAKSLRYKTVNGMYNKNAAIIGDEYCNHGIAFPTQIILGLLQLLLAISLVALGSLLIVREVSLSAAGCGIWTGLIAAITGALGVVGLQKTQTSFLALSLVCIASSTLALAISGVGLSRDINQQSKGRKVSQNNSYGLDVIKIFMKIY